jgi:hypothetical protein
VGGEAYFALAMECQLWRGLRSFPRRPLKARFPPFCDIPLAAHSPTEHTALQTADIARRLMRGGELHQRAEGP